MTSSALTPSASSISVMPPLPCLSIVKTPAESKGDWDFYKILKTLKPEEAYGKLADSACPLVKK